MRRRPTSCPISWVELAEGETLAPHRHPTQSMMVFYAGTGQMLGDRQGPVREGQGRGGRPCGAGAWFHGGAGGLQALSIRIRKRGSAPTPPSLASSSRATRTRWKELLAYNDKRLAEFVTRPIFPSSSRTVRSTTPEAKSVPRYSPDLGRRKSNPALLAPGDHAETPRTERHFLQHMHEEMGHEALHRSRSDGSGSETKARDPLMEAITNWFAYQMYVLDNAEKTAMIHLVIEKASAAYHRRARPALAKYLNDQYFEVHVDADDDHAAMGERLLRREAPRTYAGLRAIVGEAWDMLGAMTDRVAERSPAAVE